MLACRSLPRSTTVTLRVCCERNIIAWPAELPPPTTTTFGIVTGHQFGLRGSIVDAQAVEALTLGYVKLAIRCPRGNQDAAGRHGPVAFNVDDRQIAVQVQGADLGRRRELRPEFLGLQHGTAHQVGPRDAGGETQVVLNLGGCAGLAARPGAVKDERPEPFRSAIHGGRQPGRPGADDDQVIAVLVERALEAHLFGQLRERGIAQQGPVAVGDNRQVFFRDAEIGQQLADAAVDLNLHPSMRNLVAGQKLAELKRTQRIMRTDHAQALEAGFHQQFTAGDESVENRLAQPRLLAQQAVQVAAGDMQHLGQHPRPRR